jgi:hypothetical protein
MKTTALITLLSFISSFTFGQDFYLNDSLVEVDTTYIVYLGEFKSDKSIDTKEIPYELVKIKTTDKKQMYFFGKFKTACDAEHVCLLAELNGIKKAKVYPYVDYKYNENQKTYDMVCSNP